MDPRTLPPAALAEMAAWLNQGAQPDGTRGELPLFINDAGPFLLREAPLRLLPIPMRVAYALVRACFRGSITWPTYTPGRDWVVRATSNVYYCNG